MPFLGLDDNEQVECEGCHSLEFVRRCFVGPHVGVRKAGLVSTSACTPLGAVLFCGVVSAGNPNDCHDDSDACPLGRCNVDTGYHRASSETVYPRLQRNEIHHWCAVGQELMCHPFSQFISRTTRFEMFFGQQYNAWYSCFRETSTRPSRRVQSFCYPFGNEERSNAFAEGE